MKTTKEIKNYSIGLDIGTTSVGWAVMNNEYAIVRHDGKRMWGINLFDAGESAQNRRTQRTARRRLERRKERIRLLQKLMENDVLQTDDSFYIKLKYSFLNQNDEFGRTHKYNLFNDNDFTDKDFYKLYPSIYHLRKALIESDERFDIRLVYLALHHIIKYRGNFLSEGNAEDFKGYSIEYFENYFNEIKELGYDVLPYIEKINDIEKELLDKSKKKSDRIDNLKALFEDKEQKDFIVQFAKAVFGQKFELGKVCKQENVLDDNDKPLKISFDDGNYDENVDDYTQRVGDGAPILGALQTLYYSIAFKEILGENDFISYAMCDKYETHKKDFYNIKGLMKNYCSEMDYAAFFTSNPQKLQIKLGSDAKGLDFKVCYYNYIHCPSILPKSTGKNNDTRTPNQIIIDKVIQLLGKTPLKEELENDERYKKLLALKEERELLPKLNSKTNSLVPYQMNYKELELIIQNQGKYYPTLRENADKIKKLLEFRRPYFVGVIGKGGKTKWYDKEIEGTVYPWNFEEKVNQEYAQEKFIVNLTNSCSIFPEEDVLPLNSFLYSEYMVLNELNKIKIKGNLMTASVKQQLFKDLFCSANTKASVSKKDIISWYRANQSIDLKPDDISGLQDEDKLANIFKPYRDFQRILGDVFDSNKIPKYEEIVRINTIFTDTKSRLDFIKKILAKEIDDKIITQKQLTALSKLNYKGWGKFSKKVLDGILSTEEGNRRTVIAIMRDTTQNFMEIKYDKKYGFESQMQPKKRDIKNFYEDCIRDSYCSPAVKKAINQAVKIILEIIDIMGCAPSAVYIESADGEDLDKKKQKPKSRSSVLSDKYKDCDKALRDSDFEKCIEELNKQIAADKDNKSKTTLFDDRLYLYFTQLGKCMYSGEPLHIEELSNYEIDHIVPQSLIKDDSLNNRVLVKKLENQYKSNNLVLDKTTIEARKPLWSKLLKMNLIDKKKFDALTREKFDERDIERFVERQLVETRQTIKEVEKILKELPQLEGKDVVKIPAKSCDMLKSALGYFKVRALNDLHHAKDAYIAAVLGRFTSNTMFVNDPHFRKKYLEKIWRSIKTGVEDKYIKSQKMRYGIVVEMMMLNSIVDNTAVSCDEKGEIISQERQLLTSDGEIIWSDTYLDTLKHTMNYNDCLLTKKTEEWANSDFYDQTIYGKTDKKASIPLKMMKNADGQLIPLPTKSYGGYSSISSAYAMAIEYKKGKKWQKAVVNVPLLEVYKDNVDGYLKKEYGEYAPLVDEFGKPVMLHKNQMVKYKGQLCYFVSDSELNNATQIKGKQYWQEALSKIEKANEKKRELTKDNMTEEQYAKISKQMKTFVVDYLEQLEKRFPLYNNVYENLCCFIDKGGYDALPFEQQQKFILDLLKITSTAGRADMNYKSIIDNEEVAIKRSGMGRLSISSIDLDNLVIIYRSITGLRQRKTFCKDLTGGKK